MQDYIIVTDDMLDDSYLEHYGVVGMKWHHRKAVAAASKGNYKKMQKHLNKNIANTERMSKLGKIDPIAKRTSKITKYNKVTENDINRRRVAKNIAIKAGIGAGAGALVGYTAIQAAKHIANKKAMNNRYMSAEERMRYQSAQPHVVMDNIRRAASPNTSSSSKPKQHASASDAAEALRRYQEAANRAASSLDNTRNKRKRR